MKFLKLLLFIILISCQSNDEYDILNKFLDKNKIHLENLSIEPFHFEEFLYECNESFSRFSKEYQFEIPQQRYKIDTSKIKNKIQSNNPYIKTYILKPFLSKDKKYKVFLMKTENNKAIDYDIYIFKSDKIIDKGGCYTTYSY